MIDLERSLSDYAEFLEERSLAHAPEDTAVIDLDPEVRVIPIAESETTDMKRKHWGMLSLAAAVVVAVVVVGGVVIATSSDDDNSEDVATEPTAAADPGEDPTTVDEPTATAAPESDLPVLTFEFGPLPQDTYRVETLSTPFSVTIDTPVWQFENGGGVLALGRGTSDGPGDLDMWFMDLTALWDPRQPDVRLSSQGDAWPSDDFAGWLDNLPEWVIVSDRQETTVGGRDAIRVDLELGEVECVETDPYCVGFGKAGSKVRGLTLEGKSRVWVIDQGEEPPIAVIAAIQNEEGVAAWFDFVDVMVASISFEDG